MNPLMQKCMMSFGIFFVFSLLSYAGQSAESDQFGGTAPSRVPKNLAIVTYVSDHEQAKQTEALIKGIRELSGPYRNCPVYIGLAEPDIVPGNRLQGEGVTLFPLVLDPVVKAFPFTAKVFAAAQAERMVKDKCRTLVYVDPDVLITGPISGLDLVGSQYEAVLRTVSLNNGIGLLPDQEPDAYWRRIYVECGVAADAIPILPTLVDEVAVRGYMNCQVYAVNPKLGVLAKWARILDKLLQDEVFPNQVCRSRKQKIFLHQAVFSAAVFSIIDKDNIRPLEPKYNYPFSHHKELAESKQAARLNDVSVIVFDWTWTTNPNWMDTLPVDEPLKSWLFDTYLSYLQVADRVYRVEGSCNSYLVTTSEGSVLIDPAGASASPQWFRYLIKQYPLKAILITHGHADHREHVGDWKTNDAIPVIAQREHLSFLAYQDRFARYFARRAALWKGEDFDEQAFVAVKTAIEPTVLFTDTYAFALGGVHFTLMHTPGEAPDTMLIWSPELKTVFVGDNYYEFFPNLYTLRGTPPRSTLGYIAAMDKALSFGPEYFCPGHRRPLIGKEHIRRTVTNYRDVLQYVHDETVKGINAGKDVYTLMREIDLPEHLAPLYEIYGKVDWSVRGIYDGYLGWFDGNPANMYAQPASAILPDLVRLAGGCDALVQQAETYLKAGEYVKILHITDAALTVDPKAKAAWEIRLKALQALRRGPYNYIEFIFLDDAIRKAKTGLGI